MWLEATCSSITQQQWDKLMKGARKLNYNWLVNKIKKELPDIYRDLRLDLWNPYSGQTYVTKTHYILTSSSVEYFFNKGENEYNDLYENQQTKNMKKQTIKLNENQLRNLIKENIKKTLKENALTPDNSYTGNDLDYQTINDNAYAVLPKMEKEGLQISWKTVAEYLGYRLETLNDEDLELIKDAIEDAMYDDAAQYGRTQPDTPIDNPNVINESQLTSLIKERLKKTLYEHYSHDIDDDNYYGGGLPDNQEQNVIRTTEERRITKIYQTIKPLLDELTDILNNCDYCEHYDEIMNAIGVLDNLPEFSKNMTTTEIDN
ncbi:MAG: hypothetical protein MJ237_06175 [bacterium]|nr:hypothetical protein [bacterium]